MKYYMMIGAAILVSAMVLGSWRSMTAQGTFDPQPEGAVVVGTDINPAGPPEVLIPARYQPEPDANASGNSFATVYFTPQDTNTSTTVLFLYNTGTVTATVELETFDSDGTTFISTSVSVPPGGLVRICGDTVSSPAPSWQDPIIVNFTDTSVYAKMSLPTAVHADAYVVWNDGSTYDPQQIAPTLPIRFSSDPFTINLPSILDG